MREIKFKAWDKEDSIMLESGFTELMDEYITSTGKILEKQVDIGIGYSDVYLVDISNKRILMQYTGLKDKNGKEIYEGDVVEFKSMSKIERHCVEYSEYGEWCVGMHRLPMRFQTCEVVGNIYENPELLERK